MSRFGHLQIRDIKDLASEMQDLKQYGMTSSDNGSGQILGFVKGLRISARLIYFLRKALEDTDYQVGWGHIIDCTTEICSPECDVIIYEKGAHSRWNGNEKPIMEFVFVESKNVKGVISCKSILAAVEQGYPEKIIAMGIEYTALFAEACSRSNYENLKQQAIEAGYSGLWCSYFTESSGSEFVSDDFHLLAFKDHIKSKFV